MAVPSLRLSRAWTLFPLQAGAPATVYILTLFSGLNFLQQMIRDRWRSENHAVYLDKWWNFTALHGQLIRTPTCDWHNGSAHDRVVFLLSKRQSFEPIFSLWWKIVRKILVGFMFYVDNVGLLTGLREFNFYGLVLKQQWEISPLLIERQSNIKTSAI